MNRYFAIKNIGYQDLGAENLLRVTKPNGYIMGSRSRISECTFLSFVNNVILSLPPTLPPSRKVYDGLSPEAWFVESFFSNGLFFPSFPFYGEDLKSE